ncbi:MAG: hypothetical protein Edafosvirus1_49 [Edafosvirus sp.]|uniref:Uncharacterized protein n=1 Tax=Edafosvirus sp. TaxID=2487765 RepID=A0A3G4ZS47_9VIRU|nr:MAG: hypothetical protein Edafosvirus1_49 [Edafosvirus sp.]
MKQLLKDDIVKLERSKYGQIMETTGKKYKIQIKYLKLFVDFTHNESNKLTLAFCKIKKDYFESDKIYSISSYQIEGLYDINKTKYILRECKYDNNELILSNYDCIDENKKIDSNVYDISNIKKYIETVLGFTTECEIVYDFEMSRQMSQRCSNFKLIFKKDIMIVGFLNLDMNIFIHYDKFNMFFMNDENIIEEINMLSDILESI